jgi:hypothetical protein
VLAPRHKLRRRVPGGEPAKGGPEALNRRGPARRSQC